MNNHLTFGGVSTRDFNTWISGEAIYETPEKDVTLVSVPGRSGDLVIDNKRFKNITLKYPAFIKKDFDRNFSALKEYLFSCSGYKRLNDTYHPDEYRLAVFTGGLSPKTMPDNREGTFEIVFNCKPYRYLKSGEAVETFETSSQIFNKCLYDSCPLLRVYGTGDLGIGSKTIRVRRSDGYVDIDCETGDCSRGVTNCNGDVEMPEDVRLVPGMNNISLWSGITRIELTPRWRKI